MAGTGAQARDLGSEDVTKPHAKNQEPRGTSLPHGGAIGKAIGHGLRLARKRIAGYERGWINRKPLWRPPT